MNKLLVILAILSWHFGVTAQDAKSILEKSIHYHDPKGEWSTFNHQMIFTSQRPDGPDRKSTVSINNNKGYFNLEEAGNNMSVLMDSCIVIPSGKTCDNVKRTRNYYVYLWGLPMKLKDKGTNPDSKVTEQQMEGKDCYVIRVPYEEDVWFFYIDKASYAMVAYKFYKDEPAEKGEIIYLTDEVLLGSMRIPQKRKWVTTPDGKYLGTDILTSFN